jgi:hypothetical protein
MPPRRVLQRLRGMSKFVSLDPPINDA